MILSCCMFYVLMHALMQVLMQVLMHVLSMQVRAMNQVILWKRGNLVISPENNGANISARNFSSLKSCK